jgi:hypothetical protein
MKLLLFLMVFVNVYIRQKLQILADPNPNLLYNTAYSIKTH